MLKNNCSQNEKLNGHQKGDFGIGTKFASPYSHLFMTGLEFFETVNLNLSCGYDTLMRFFV